MKLAFNTILICLLSFSSFAQKSNEKKDKAIQEVIDLLPVHGNKIVYEKVFVIDSLSKDIIFDRLREWNVGAFMDYQRSIKIDDKSTGIIVSQMESRVYKRAAIISFTGQVAFTVSLVAKDGKYNCQLSDFYLRTNNNVVKTFNDIFRQDQKYKLTRSELAIMKETGLICKAVVESIYDRVSANKSVTEF